MPSITPDKPHAITCIKRSIRDCLRFRSGDDLTVVCDLDDCWRRDELFKHRQAVNIMAQTDVILQPIKIPREKVPLGGKSDKETKCLYKSRLNVEIQIYVEDCHCEEEDEDCDCLNGKDKAYSILGHITETLACHESDIVGQRIIYRGSTAQTNSDGEYGIALVIANYEVDYVSDPTRPSWVG